MTRTPSVLRNAGWLTGAFLLGRGASLVWQLVLARFLTDRVEVYGQLGVLLALSAICILLAEFGLNVSAQQEWPKGRFTAAELLGILGTLRLLFGGLSVALLIGTVYALYGRGEMLSASLPMAVSLFVSGQLQSPVGVFEARQEMRTVAILSGLQTAVLIPAQFLALRYWGTLFALCAAIAVSSIVTAGYGWLRAVRAWGRPRLPRAGRAGEALRLLASLGLPVALSSITFVLYYRIDAVLLSKWVSDAAAGVFVLATLLFMGLVDASWSQMGKALFPQLADAWVRKGDPQGTPRHLGVMVRLYLVFSIVVLALGLTVGERVLRLVFGATSPWLQTWQPLMILTLGFWPIVLYGLCSRLLLLEGRRYWYAGVVVASTILKFTLAVYLIKSLGATGAAVSNTLSQLAMTGLTLGGLGTLATHVVPWRLRLQYVVSVIAVAAGWWLTRAWAWYLALGAEVILVGVLVSLSGLTDVVREAGRRSVALLSRRPSPAT